MLNVLRWIALVPCSFLGAAIAGVFTGLVAGFLLSLLPLSQGTVQVLVDCFVISAAFKMLLTAGLAIAPSHKAVAAGILIALFVVFQVTGLALSNRIHWASMLVLAFNVIHGLLAIPELARLERAGAFANEEPPGAV